MTPRELTRDETDSVGRPFTDRELLLRGRPNWPAAGFFLCIALLHAYIAIHAFATNPWEGFISAFLAPIFVFVACVCLLSKNQMMIRPRQRQILIHAGIGKLTTDRIIPFTAVRGVRVTLWQSRGGQQRSRLDILCNGEEIPCPPTTIPRQQALYLALVMNVHLIKISDDRTVDSLARQRSDASRW